MLKLSSTICTRSMPLSDIPRKVVAEVAATEADFLKSNTSSKMHVNTNLLNLVYNAFDFTGAV